MNHRSDYEYFRDLDIAAAEEFHLDDHICSIRSDIELGRGTTASDVAGYVSGEESDKALAIIARHLLEQYPSKDTAIERLLRPLIEDAILALAQAEIAAEKRSAEADLADRYRWSEGA